MKSNSIRVLIALMAFLLIAGWSGSLTSISAPPPPRWSYRVVTRDLTPIETEETFLMHRGAEGWELLQVQPAQNGATRTYYFKAPL
jgi:hypothetical protein